MRDDTGGCPASFGRFQGPVGQAGADAAGALDGKGRLLSSAPLAVPNHGSQGENERER